MGAVVAQERMTYTRRSAQVPPLGYTVPVYLW